MVKTKDGQYVEKEDFVGEFMFQDDNDEDYNAYLATLGTTSTHKKNFKEEVKSFFGKASIFGK